MRSKRVLIVDDEIEIQMAISRTLHDHFDCAFNYAQTSKEAIGILDITEIDLLLTDWNLLEGIGGDIIYDLRRKSRNIPTIIISGETAVHMQKHAAPVITTIEKPFSGSHLVEVIKDTRVLADAMRTEPPLITGP